MSRAIRILTCILLPLFTLILGWQLGMAMQERELQDIQKNLEVLYGGQTASGTVVQDPEKEVNPALMWGVWRLLSKNYIAPEKMKTQEMLYGAVGGLVEAVGDPYTVFMTPTENQQFHQSLQGRLEGIGAELTLRDKQVVIVAPLKGSPAAEAGLAPEDIIVKVNDEDVTGKSLVQVDRKEHL